MKILNAEIRNFRGIQKANISFTNSQILLGDNNTGKTTVLEALDLVLGPDRLSRFPVVDEHDFYLGDYYTDGEGVPIGQDIIDGDFGRLDKVFTDENTDTIAVLVTLVDLSQEQKSAFGGRCEYYSRDNDKILETGTIQEVDQATVTDCLRILFLGHYDAEVDDFVGRTYYYKDLLAHQADEVFKKQKQLIGFLYLRALRTGSRALSLERGSLLDIVLRAREVKPKMWEDVLERLDQAQIPIDEEDEIGKVLADVQEAINRYVPKEWGTAPKLKVSRMTREDLRRTIVAFIETDATHNAPYYRQGTGTTNMLVLALLSIIRDNKQNVIFAMEEPETAIPPHVQKQVVKEVMANSDQSIFTSHSPYVIEEFDLSSIAILSIDLPGTLSHHSVTISDPSCYNYHQYFRTQLCEGLLARRVVVCEGATEVSILAGLSRHLSKLDDKKYGDLAALGYCLINSQTDSQVLNHTDALSGLGKHVSVFCDAQDAAEKAKIKAAADEAFIHKYERIEDMLIDEVPDAAKHHFNKTMTWPQYVLDDVPVPADNIDKALKRYLKKTKGSGGAVALLAACKASEVPDFLRDMIEKLTTLARPNPAPTEDDQQKGVEPA
ncbi:AAA family ATPase [uncultured Tateyamaria sp.]|uniref:ATP-dependent nuclease n=1 Tax=uncultured Tateyamaria sp. TaxID=455651 RepID=UPI002616B91F|nr:AAA family ATPase [uncultured Tateyamaria sp.]